MDIKKILVTTDLSDHSQSAFELAAYQAKISGAVVHLITVLADWEVPISLYPSLSGADVAQLRDIAKVEAQKRLDSFISEFNGREVKTAVVLTPKPVAEAIVEYAKENGCGMIVMSSHGRGSIGTLFLGSAVQRVLKMAECPVLVSPRKLIVNR